MCAVSLGLLISAFAPDVPSATALAPPVTIVFMLVGCVRGWMGGALAWIAGWPKATIRLMIRGCTHPPFPQISTRIDLQWRLHQRPVPPARGTVAALHLLHQVGLQRSCDKPVRGHDLCLRGRGEQGPYIYTVCICVFFLFVGRMLAYVYLPCHPHDGPTSRIGTLNKHPVVCVSAKMDQHTDHPTIHPSTRLPPPKKQHKQKGCVTTGEQVLRLYAMDQYSIGQCALAMVGITAAFTALGYVVLK